MVMKQINPKIHNKRYFEFLKTVHNVKELNTNYNSKLNLKIFVKYSSDEKIKKTFLQN